MKDGLYIQPGTGVRVRMPDGTTAAGEAYSTAHAGTELLSIGFYSPALGHRNRITDSIYVPAYRLVTEGR